MSIILDHQLREMMAHDTSAFPINYFQNELALLALAGDLGGSVGPSLVGSVSSMADGNLKTGLLVATLFPVLLIAGLVVLKKWVKTTK